MDYPIALKEWATVLTAMELGEQLIMIRKGGLIEPGSGFQLLAREFLLYPTYEHQAVQYLRAPYQAYFQQAQQHRSPEGQLRFVLAAEAVGSLVSHDPSLVERLSGFHIYNDVFLQQRLKWQPDQPLMVVVVRVFRLPSPVMVPAAPSYAGCRSWVQLESPVTVVGRVPVLDEELFARRRQELANVLGTL